MNRPFIFCHMMTSLDGKIMGNYMSTPEGSSAGDVFYRIAFGESPHYRHQGWLSGRVTTDDNFTFYEKPVLDENALPVPEGDYIADPDAGMYYVSVDPRGRLGWKSNTLTYKTTTAHVLEILTNEASNAYKAFLRKLGISYIIAGERDLDLDKALHKLYEYFGIRSLMLGGGGVLNWSFIQAGLCDELSVVIAAAADASPDTPALFTAKSRLSENEPVGFELVAAEAQENSSLWLRYRVKTN